jgi:hypothetical protein
MRSLLCNVRICMYNEDLETVQLKFHVNRPKTEFTSGLGLLIKARNLFEIHNYFIGFMKTDMTSQLCVHFLHFMPKTH